MAEAGSQFHGERPNGEVFVDEERIRGENLRALREFYANPIENDRYISAFRAAMIDQLKSGGEPASSALFSIAGHKSVSSNPELPKIYATNLYNRYLQKHLMRQPPPGLRYPEDFHTPEAWIQGMDHVAQLDAYGADLLICTGLGIKSNVVDRYKSLKLLLNLTRDRFENPPRILDIGCSQNLGLKSIAGNLSFFNETLLMDENGREVELHSPLEQKFYRNHVLPVEIGQSFGVDLISPKDVNVADWVRSCSFYPSELMDHPRLRYYDRVEGFEHENVGFICNDFVKPYEGGLPEGRVRTRLPEPGTVDFLVLSSIEYQLDEEARHTVHKRSEELRSPGGYVLVQEFARVDPQNPRALDITPWHNRTQAASSGDAFPYKAFVLGPENSYSELRTFLEWTNGRCRSLRLGDYALEKLSRAF